MILAAAALSILATGALIAGLAGLVAAEGRLDAGPRGADLI